MVFLFMFDPQRQNHDNQMLSDHKEASSFVPDQSAYERFEAEQLAAEAMQGELVRIRNHHVKKEQAVARMGTEPTPLEITKPLDQENAAAFLTSELSWGETGFDLLSRIRKTYPSVAGAAPTDFRYSSIAGLVEEVHEQFSRFDLREAIDTMIEVGLLVTTSSFQYPPYPNEKQTIFVVNNNSEALDALLQLTAPGENIALNKERAREILSRENIVNEENNPLRQDLTPADILEFFRGEPKTYTQAFNHPGFYPNETVRYNGSYVTPVIESIIEESKSPEVGLIMEIEGHPPTYLLTQAGEAFISEDRENLQSP